MNRLPKRDYQTLDAILVVLGMASIGFALWALVYVDIPEAQLPIVASVVSGILGTIVGGYAGFRWATSMESKQNAAALGQLAGAGPPPPSPPLAEIPAEESLPE